MEAFADSPDLVRHRAGAIDRHARLIVLERVGQALADAEGHGVVASCSALRRAYRDRLRALAGPLFFVLPEVPREELSRRLEERRNSFMPPSLLDSQLATLEPLKDGEVGMTIDGTRPVASEIRRVRERL